MQLEDHVGDVIRKARKMNDIPSATGAAAAGLSPDDFSRLEREGICAPPVNYPKLAQVIGLNPAKLQGLADQWLPKVHDLGRWRQSRSFTTAAEDLTVNAYLIWDESIRQAALFDTGVDAAPVLACLAQNQLQLAHVFITHSHWDHVDALPQIRQAFPGAQLHSNAKGAPARQRLQADETVALGRLRVATRATPGHAEDGLTYLITGWPENAPAMAVVGDTIFAGSMGNGNGQWALALQKIREEILSLPGETLLCPGHGPLTTVAEELEHNPFF